MSTLNAEPSIHSHRLTDSVLQSDQSTQNDENVTAVVKAALPVPALTAGYARRFCLVALSSRSPPMTTKAPRIAQKAASCGVSGKPPRSQNHW